MAVRIARIAHRPLTARQRCAIQTFAWRAAVVAAFAVTLLSAQAGAYAIAAGGALAALVVYLAPAYVEAWRRAGEEEE